MQKKNQARPVLKYRTPIRRRLKKTKDFRETVRKKLAARWRSRKREGALEQEREEKERMRELE